MATFGSVFIGINTRDGEEEADTTWKPSGTDSDGNILGNFSGTVRDIGLSWDNVTVPQGSIITSAFIELFPSYRNGNVPIDIYGFNVDDVAVFGASNRPSQIAQTTAHVTQTLTTAIPASVYFNLADVSTIIQEIVNRGGWASGNALGVVIKDNGAASGVLFQMQDYGNAPANAARLTINYTEPSVSCDTSGTATASINESDIVAGGKTIILTLTGDTFVAAGTGPIGSTADTQALIDGITSAQTEALGWNNEVRDKEVTTSVIRTSNTVATITLTAAASYNITAQETITPTIPAAVLTGASPIVSSPTFTVDVVGAGSSSPIYYFRDTEAGADTNAVAGSDAASGLTDALAKETYGELLSLYNAASAGTRFRIARGCAFLQTASAALHNVNSCVTITGITRSGSTATATTSKAHNLLNDATTDITGAVQTEYNGTSIAISNVTATTFDYTVSGTPATPATTLDVIRFTGGEITIESYVSAEFTPAVDAKPITNFNFEGYQHSYANATTSEGYAFRGAHYKYIGVNGSGGIAFIYTDITQKDTLIIDDCYVEKYRIAFRPKENKNFQLLNSTITDCYEQGWLGGGANGLIEGNVFSNNGHNITGGSSLLHNMYMTYGSGNVIRGNTFYQSAMDGGSGLGSASGVSLVVHGVVTDLIIEDNFLYEDIGACANGAWGIAVDTGYSTYESFTNITIRRNTIKNMGNCFINASSWVGGIIENNVLIQQQVIGTVGIRCRAANQGASNAVNSDISVRNNSINGVFTTGIEASDGTGFEIVSNALESTVTGTVNMLNVPLSIINNTNYDAIDNNVGYAPSASTFNYEATVGNLAAWQAASIFDDNSQVADPLFTSATNLAPLVGSPLIDTGHLTLSATEDYLEVTRDATPDIGAYEYAGADTTAPVLSSPAGTKTGSSTADGSVSTDEGNGTLYYLATTNATESAATIKTGSSQAVIVAGTQNINFTGLSANTTYYAHYVHDDDATNESNVVSGASFTTDSAAAGSVLYGKNGTESGSPIYGEGGTESGSKVYTP